MIEIKAPAPFPEVITKTEIFLAGSIEQGSAVNWQSLVVQALAPLDIVIFNPRRDDWNAGITQSISDPDFHDQVLWELDGLDRAKYIIMYFDPNTQSPISLLELGLHVNSGKMIVCCPNGFWRKGNVDIVCAAHNVPVFETLEEVLIRLGIRMRLKV